MQTAADGGVPGAGPGPASSIYACRPTCASSARPSRSPCRSRHRSCSPADARLTWPSASPRRIAASTCTAAEPGRKVEIVSLRFTVRRRLDNAAGGARPRRRRRPRRLRRRSGWPMAAPSPRASSTPRRLAPGDDDRRPGADRGLYRDHLGAAGWAAPRGTRPATSSSRGGPDMTPRPRRLRRHQPGADRRRARDGREAHPLRLLDHPARGARRLGRAARRARATTVAQAELIPMQLGTIGDIFSPARRSIRRRRWRQDDFLLNNDPYSGGQHLQDVFIFHPIFVDGTVIGFAASVAHHLDLGGGAPGLESGGGDVYAEGLIIPPMKINMQTDWNGGGFERLIARQRPRAAPDHGRFQRAVRGQRDGRDARAGTRRALRRGQGAGRDGRAAGLFRDAACAPPSAPCPMASTTARTRSTTTGRATSRWWCAATVTVAGDTVAVDFTGTGKQVGRNLNAPFASTISASVSALKAVLTSPDIPFNDGAMRPITVTAPQGLPAQPASPGAGARAHALLLTAPATR